MKKLFSLIIVILLLGISAAGCRQYIPVDDDTFTVDEYRRYIEDFSSDENVGPIVDAEDAAQKAEEVWIRIYGEDIKDERPYIVSYDEENGVWMVKGSLPPFALGGVANILIENDTGKVLAVWHGK